MLNKLKFLFLDALVWLGAHWWAIGLLVALVVFIFILFWADSCRTKNYEQKKEEIKTNITTGKIESNIAQNGINSAANVSNQALTNVNISKNADSNKFSNSYTDAMNRFCEQFPKDSLCTK